MKTTFEMVEVGDVLEVKVVKYDHHKEFVVLSKTLTHLYLKNVITGRRFNAEAYYVNKCLQFKPA